MIKRADFTRNIKEELLYLEEEFSGKSRRLFKRIDQNKPFDLNAYKNTGLELAVLKTMASNSVDIKNCLLWYVEF